MDPLFLSHLIHSNSKYPPLLLYKYSLSLSLSLSLQISSPSILYNGRASNLREYDLFAIKEVGWIGSLGRFKLKYFSSSH